ncbi:MAG: phosphoglycolate phosphatase [Burkholderiaceae bacterium]
MASSIVRAPEGLGVRPLAGSERLQPLRAVIVDLDGTMVDTLGDFRVALNGMLSDLNLPAVDCLTVERAVGKGSEHLVRTVLNCQRAMVDGTQSAGEGARVEIATGFDAALARYQHHYRLVNGLHSAVYPGVVDGLAALKARGLALACLTNKPLAFARDLLRMKGLGGYFSQVFGGDSFERKKPDPLPLRRTCEALDCRPEQTLMVGDSRNDAQAARGAGCPVVLVSYGYNHGEPIRSVEADGYVSSMAEIPALF